MNYATFYALVDCNHFYVSCERVFKPELEHKPVAVLSNNDGCIVALSPELKKLGVQRGTPWFKIKHLIKKHDIRIFSSNYTLYGDMSFRVMSVLDRFTPDLEVYSIDESFLDLSKLAVPDFTGYGKTIKQTVRKWTGIPVSVGMASTRTLAKIANRIAKKKTGNTGVFAIDNEDLRLKVLQETEVEDIWGIGSRYAAKLKRDGIKNARQLTNVGDDWILENMTVVGLRMVEELRGNPYVNKVAENAKSFCKSNTKAENTGKNGKGRVRATGHEDDVRSRSEIYLPNAGQRCKNIVSSRSFGKPVESYQELKEALSSYCDTALNKLRRQESLAKNITVFLTTNPFKDEPQYANYREAVLTGYSAYPPDFIHAAGDMLKKIYRKGYRYKKLGVMITNIISQEEAPQDLFDTAYVDDYRSHVMDCVDNINKRWGQRTITFAGAGTDKKWKMKRKMLSPRYTTSFNELPVVKAY